MKTTLKRGSARGNANGVPSFPPSPLTAVTRYGPRRRSRWRLVGTIVLWASVALFVCAGALAGGVWLFLNESVSAIRAHSPEAKEAQKVLDVPVPGEPTVAIVIGYDKRAGVDKANPARSDTVMLVRADPKLKVISMLSFPRDLVVEIQACRGHESHVARINQAFTECGQRGTLETVRALTGVPINYMITVNFHGFKEVVNKLGGVYMDVDRRYFNDNAGRGVGQTYATIDLQPGYQRLMGAAALDYVRYRHTDSDLYRNARQQEFVKAVKQQISGLSAVSKLPGIVRAVADNVEVGVGGSGQVDLTTVLGYAKLAYDLPGGNFHQVRLENLQENDAFELSVSQADVDMAVERFVNPDADAGVKAASAATGEKPKRAPRRGPPPSQVTVEVLNGNAVTGAADEAAYLLSRRGYQAVNAGNADRSDYFQTQVVYDPADPNAKAAAEDLARLFGAAQVEPAPPDLALGVVARVIVGRTFQGTLGPGPTDATPKHEPPAVEPDPGVVAPRIQEAQRGVEFPLLVPTVREEGSELSVDESAVRVYDLDGHDALRVVYNGPDATDYWGVQETSWTEAPALDGPTLTRTIGGREYRLFFNGAHLHLVGFEENGAAYWVVNTLLDRLSNETMLAIAKGLKPVSR